MPHGRDHDFLAAERHSIEEGQFGTELREFGILVDLEGDSVLGLGLLAFSAPYICRDRAPVGIAVEVEHLLVRADAELEAIYLKVDGVVWHRDTCDSLAPHHIVERTHERQLPPGRSGE